MEAQAHTELGESTARPHTQVSTVLTSSYTQTGLISEDG